MHPLAGAIARLLLLALLAVTLGSVQAAGAEHLYVVNTGSFNVSAFTINSDGSLTPVTGPPSAVGLFPSGAAVDLKGRFLYVTNGIGIWAFSISADGSLTPVPGSPFSTTIGTVLSLVVSEPGGDFLYVTNVQDNTISVYAINPLNGAITLSSTASAGPSPLFLAADKRKFLYVTNAGSNNISGYRINPASGALRPLHLSPFTSGPAPHGIAVDPSARFAYVANFGSNDVSAYEILHKGDLTPVVGSPFSAGLGPDPVAVDPTGRFVYVGNAASIDISGYTLNLADGSITPIAGSPFPAPSVQGDLHHVAIDPAGKFLYAALFSERTDNIAGFMINSDGSLTPLAGSPFTQPGVAPNWIVITPF